MSHIELHELGTPNRFYTPIAKATFMENEKGVTFGYPYSDDITRVSETLDEIIAMIEAQGE